MGRSPSLIVNCISLSGVREAESLATNSRYLKFLLTLAAPVSLPPGVSGFLSLSADAGGAEWEEGERLRLTAGEWEGL